MWPETIPTSVAGLFLLIVAFGITTAMLAWNSSTLRELSSIVSTLKKKVDGLEKENEKLEKARDEDRAKHSQELKVSKDECERYILFVIRSLNSQGINVPPFPPTPPAAINFDVIGEVNVAGDVSGRDKNLSQVSQIQEKKP